MLVVEGIDSKLDEPRRQKIEKFFKRVGRDAFRAGIIDIKGVAATVFRIWTGVERGHVDTELHFLKPRRQFFLDLFFKVRVAGKVHASFLTLFLEYGAVGHLPLDVADENPLPFCTQSPLSCMARGLPPPYLFKQGPVGQREVL